MTATTARPPRGGLWQQAKALAEQTPAERNRYVDFLRALSILAVIVGHWLVAATHVEDGVLVAQNLLGVQPWTQWLTWAFQVMPIFFFVGGYSNGVSWAATQRRGGSYSNWLVGRIQRLINPVLPLFLAWVVFISGARAFGMAQETIALASSLALIPVWFLAVYLLVVALVPLTRALWVRFGMGSFFGLLAAAALVDYVNLGLGFDVVAYANFVFVWAGMHQLGYAWQAGRLEGTGRRLALAAGGLAALCALVFLGPYPISFIGVPGQEITNSMPPKLSIFALGVFQAGLVLALEPLGRRLLARTTAWTAVILVNGMIMSLYLWHLTASVLLTAGAWGLGVGLEAVPGTLEWWLTRPLWLALFALATLPFVFLFVRFERGTVEVPERVSIWRLVMSVALVCGGLAATAAAGIGSDDWAGFRVWVVALPFLGAALVDFGPLAHRRARAKVLARR
ncbi:MAG: acyltransferase, partial [Pseudomonadales bacterium]|nr:acyltransferase [Pseudomonadales bacterium]